MFTARQALDGGLTPRQVRYRLEQGRWQQVVGRGLTAEARPDGGWPAEALAWAASLTWPEAVIGYQVAGALQGFPVRPVQPVRVFTRVRHRRQAGLLAQAAVPVPGHVVEPRPGLRITAPGRTALDCLAVLPPHAAEDLCAWLAAHGRLDRAVLTRAIVEHTGRHGIGRLRELHRRTAGGAVSEAERRLHHILRRAGVEGWCAGARVWDDVGPIGVVDVLFTRERVVVEVDGARAHATPEALVRDLRRQNRLMVAGYLVLRFTWDDLARRPDVVVAQICRALVRGSSSP